eukprot:RCo003306
MAGYRSGLLNLGWWLCLSALWGSWVAQAATPQGYYVFGRIQWNRVFTAGVPNNTVEFHLLLGCNLTQIPTVGQTGFDFAGNVLSFGDGDTYAFNETVTQVNSDTGVFFINPVITHTYATEGPYPVQILSGASARLGILQYNGVYHFRLSAVVDLRNNNSFSPEAYMPSLVLFNQGTSDFFMPATDYDGQRVTFRLATPFELGDDSSYQQTSKQPTDLAIDPVTGQITWSLSAIVGYFCCQIIVTDSQNATSAIDFLLYNQPAAARPTMGGYTTPLPVSGQAADTRYIEVYLVNTSVTFDVTATSTLGAPVKWIRSMDSASVVVPSGALQVLLVNGSNTTNTTAAVYRQTFSYTSPLALRHRMCFVAQSAAPAQSLPYCLEMVFLAAPTAATVWPVPSSAQVVSQSVVAWFSGYYLSFTDRAAVISTANGRSCANLNLTDGFQITWAGNSTVGQLGRSLSSLHSANVTLPAPLLSGPAAFCYLPTSGLANGIAAVWSMVGTTYTISDSGPYVLSSLPSQPVAGQEVRLVVYGVSLYRLDRVKILTPSVAPPGISSVTCEQLGSSDGQAIQDITLLGDPQPGFISAGAVQANFPRVSNSSDQGSYVCYRAYTTGTWTMLDYLRRPLSDGLYSVLSSVVPSVGVLNVTFQGIGLNSSDRWAAVPTKDWTDCTSAVNFTAAGPTAQNTVAVTLRASVTTVGESRYSFCYLHQSVVSKIAELVVGNPAYQYSSVPDPTTTTSTPPWVDYFPGQAYVNESVTYEFTGFAPFSYNLNDPCVGCSTLWVKVPLYGSCVGVAPGGDPRPLDENRRATFAIGQTGSFIFCINHRIDYEPVSRVLQVIAKPSTPPNTPLYGCQSCKSFLGYNSSLNACGCFVAVQNPTGGSALPTVDLPLNFTGSTATASQFSVNQGCCSNPSATRVAAGTISAFSGWGYCTMPSTTTPIPFPPYSTQCED